MLQIFLGWRSQSSYECLRGGVRPWDSSSYVLGSLLPELLQENQEDQEQAGWKPAQLWHQAAPVDAAIPRGVPGGPGLAGAAVPGGPPCWRGGPDSVLQLLQRTGFVFIDFFYITWSINLYFLFLSLRSGVQTPMLATGGQGPTPTPY